ncbi:hypothetical protein ACWJWI_20275, partial [Clostridioides difficile]
VIGSDGNIYQSVNRGNWTKITTTGATHIHPWSNGANATYSTSTTVATTDGYPYPALPAGVTITDLAGVVYNNNGYIYVIGSDGNIYQSVNRGNWTKITTTGATHIHPWS